MSETGESFLNLSRYSLDEKEQLTTESMERGEPLIYGGHISADGLLGDLSSFQLLFRAEDLIGSITAPLGLPPWSK